MPDVFDRIELGTFWRQRNDVMLAGKLISAGWGFSRSEILFYRSAGIKEKAPTKPMVISPYRKLISHGFLSIQSASKRTPLGPAQMPAVVRNFDSPVCPRS